MKRPWWKQLSSACLKHTRRSPWRSTLVPRLERLEDRTLLSAGDLDPTFGSGGKVVTDIASIDNQAKAVVVQSDGMIVVAGYSSQGGPAYIFQPIPSDFTLARYTSTGNLDTTFGSGGKVITDFASSRDQAYAVALQPDGMIVVAGSSLQGTNYYNFALARYTSTGSLDTTFGSGGKVLTDFGSDLDQAYAVVVQSDGKIVVAGRALQATGYSDFALARYTSTGSLDTSFGSGGKVATDFGSGFDLANAVLVQSDGKILAAGYSNQGGTFDFALARYTSTGSLDTTFGSGGKVVTDFASGDDQAAAVAVLSDGKIVAAGSSGQGSASNFALARYTSSGGLDPTFGSGGKVVTDFASSEDAALAVAVGSDGKIVVAGYSGTIYTDAHDFAVARYTSNGTLDTSFGSSGRVVTAFSASGDDQASAVAVQSDGNTVVAGYSSQGSTSYDFAVARYLGDANRPPVADAGGPYAIAEGGSLSLDASGSSDPDGDSLTCSWDVNGDGVFGDATGIQPSLTWEQVDALLPPVGGTARTFDVRVRIDDGQGHVAISPVATLTVNPAFAFWVNPAGGDWDVGSNWNTGQVPRPFEEVVIDLGDNSFTVTIAAGVHSVSNLTCWATLTMSGGTLQAGDVTVNRRFNWLGGTLSGAGTTTIGPNATLEIRPAFGGTQVYNLDGRAIVNLGTARLQPGVAGSSVSWAMTHGAAFDNQGNFAALNTVSATIYSDGSVVAFHNRGTFVRDGAGAGLAFGRDAAAVAFHNSGAVEVRAGALYLDGGGTSTGSFSVASGAAMQMFGSHTLEPSSLVEGAGRVDFGLGGATVAGTYAVTGTTGLFRGGAHFTGTVLPLGGLDVFDSTADFHGAAVSVGTVFLIGGTILSGDMQVTERFDWVVGTLGGSGTTTIGPNATLEVRPAFGGTQVYNLDGRAIVNLGTARLQPGVAGSSVSWAMTHGATFDNQGNFAALNTVPATIYSDGSVVAFHNRGTFVRDGAGAGLAFGRDAAAVAFHNSGAVEVRAGALYLDGGGTSTGSFSVASGAAMQMFGSHTLEPSSLVEGAGRVDFGLGGATVAGTYAVTGTTGLFRGGAHFTGTVLPLGGLDVFDSTADFHGAAVSVGTVFLIGGTILSGDMQVTERLDWVVGTLGGSGTTTIGPNATLEVRPAFGGTQVYNLDGRAIVNLGTARLQPGVAGSSVSWAMTHGAAFDNQGNFEALNTVPATIYSDGSVVAFHNRGTFVRDGAGAGLAFGRDAAAVAFHNSGAVEVRAGALYLDGGGTSTGSFSVASGAAMQMFGSHTLEPSSLVEGAGRVDFGLGGATVAGTYAVTGTTGLFRGGAHFTGTVLPLGGLDVFDSTADFHGAAVSVGTVFLIGGTILSGDMQATERLDWLAGTLGGTGTTTIGPNATLEVRPPFAGEQIYVLDGRTVVNQGTARLVPGAASSSVTVYLRNGAAIDNQGTFAALNTAKYRVLGDGTAVAFHNQGTFVRSGAPGSVGQGAPFEFGSSSGVGLVAFHNTGAVDVQIGELSLLGGGDSPGSFHVGADAGLYLWRGYALGDITGDGLVELALGLTTLTPTTTIAAQVLRADGTLRYQVSGATPGAGLPRITATGPVALTAGFQVELLNDFLPALGAVFTILDGPGTLTGTFAGLPEGAELQAGVVRFRISYRGGDGNDVTLTALTGNSAPSEVSLGLSANAIDEGDTVTLSGSFVDPDAGQSHTVVIDWSDGSAATTLVLAAGIFTFTVPHTYLDNPSGQPNDSYSIHVHVIDSEGASSQGMPELLVSSYYTGAVLRYDLATRAFQGELVPANTLGYGGPTGLTFGPDSNLYAATASNHSVLRFDGTTGAPLGTFVAPQSGGLGYPHKLMFGPDGDLYVTGYYTHAVYRYSGTTGAFLGTFVAPQSGGLLGPTGLAFGPDGKLYVGAFDSSQVLRYDATTGAFLDVFVASAGNPHDLEFGPDGNLYVSSFATGTVRRYDISTGGFLGTFAGPGAPLAGIIGLGFGPDGKLYLASHGTDTIARFDGTTGNYLDSITGGGLDGPTLFTFRANTDAVILVTVRNVTPAVTVLGDQSGFRAGEVADIDLGSFADPGADSPWRVAVAWGDGSGLQTFDVAAAGALGRRAHTYSIPGVYTVAVAITDKDGATGTGSFRVVTNTPPSALSLGLSAGAIDEGDTVTLSGTFADPDPGQAHTVVVTWGNGLDSTTLELAPGVFTFQIDHRYLPDGSTERSTTHPIAVMVTDGAESVSGVTSITVYEPMTVQAVSIADLNLLSDTGNLGSSEVSMSADGRFVAFVSLASNLVGTDTNGASDVFVRDLVARTTTLVSATPAGTSGNGRSSSPVLSADGRFVAFVSDASDLVANDTNGTSDVFVRDLLSGTTTLVSANVFGAISDGVSLQPAISGDGRYVAFTSYASDLVLRDGNGTADVFVRDLLVRTTTLVSANAIRASGNGPSDSPVLSANGRHVAFRSLASDLVGGDGNGTQDVFVHDLVAGTLTLVSRTPSGRSGNGSSAGPVLSADGRVVAFTSQASDLVAGDGNGSPDVFVRDLRSGSITLASAGLTGRSGNGPSSWPTLSSDGRYVAFASDASNLASGDGNAKRDVFVRDLLTGTVRLASASTTGASANGHSSDPVLSADGRYVAFSSTASNLVANDGNRTSNLYVRDLFTGTTRLASATPTGASGSSNAFGQRFSADGRYLAFTSLAGDLVPHDGNSDQDVFVRDLTAATTNLVSTRSPVLPSITGGRESSVSSVSADGRFVAFTSWADDLAPNDGNRRQDVFVRDLLTGTTTLASVTPTGRAGNDSSYGPVLSANGRYLAFTSGASDLVPNDGNGAQDVFVRDLVTGTTKLASATPTGTSGRGYSSSPVFSADGRYLAFTSSASDLVPNDLNGNVQDVFVRDLFTGVTRTVSSTLGSGFNSFESPALSADGRYVVFTGTERRADGRFYGEVLIRDLQGPATAVTRVSVSSQGASSNGSSSSPALSADGRYVSFASTATNLVSNDTNGTIQDVFVRDLLAGTTKLASATPTGSSGNNASYNPVLRADGRQLAFLSFASNLVANGGNGVLPSLNVFVRDLLTGTTTLASATPTGARGNNSSSGPMLSADGRYLAFASTASDLVPDDHNGITEDVFVRDLVTGTITLASTPGNIQAANGRSNFPVLSADGSVVAYISEATNLVGGDFNARADVFVTRYPHTLPGGSGGGGSVTVREGPDPTYPALTALFIEGTPGNDSILVAHGFGAGGLAVTVNGVLAGTTFHPTGRVYVEGRGGNDSVSVSATAPLGLWVDGQEGADTVVIAFGALAGPVTVADSGTTGSDGLIVSGTDGSDYIVKASGQVTWGNPAVETVSYSGVELFLIDGGQGNDTIIDPGSDTTILGGPGDDVIIIDATTGNGVTLDGGDGSDTYVLRFGSLFGSVRIADTGTNGSDGVAVHGTDGDDLVVVEGDQVTVAGQTVRVLSAVATLAVYGEAGNDQVFTDALTTPIQELTLDGGAGSDFFAVADPGPDVAALSVNGGPVGSGHSDQVQVEDGMSIPVTVHHLPLSVDAGTDATVNEGDSFSRQSSFRDPNANASWTATVDFGDGSGAQPLALSPDGTFLLDHTFAEGPRAYTVTVTVTGADGSVGTGTFQITVNNVAPSASIAGAADGVRGQRLAFTLAAADPSAADRTAGFTYTVSWGDGTPVQVVAATAGNGIATLVEHVYTGEGNYEVRMTATDQHGLVSPVVSRTITITAMALQPDPLASGQVMLVVGGSTNDDDIRIRDDADYDFLKVRINEHDEDRVKVRGTFPTPVSRIVVFGQDGDDNIKMEADLTVPAWLYGGPGNDRLKGGNGNNVLLGGPGDDLLVGHSGRDLLIGGTGADKLVGNADDDILIAGTTAFDDNETALAAIMAEWTSSRSYATRIANLTGTGSGSSYTNRQNGNFFLKADGPGATVFDDGAKDVLTGDAGRDWFFANLDSGVKDKITDLSANEFAADIDFIAGL